MDFVPSSPEGGCCNGHPRRFRLYRKHARGNDRCLRAARVFWLTTMIVRLPIRQGQWHRATNVSGSQLREQLPVRTGFPSPTRGECTPEPQSRHSYLGRCPMSDYTLRPVPVDDTSIEEMAALLRVVFPDAEHFTEQALRWQYRDNPDGHVVGFNAWQGAVLAAHYVTIPLVARLNGIEEKGLLSLNTATHPVHQGKGLFTKLANATYELGRSKGYGFVVGVANANSTHGFTRKLGFQLVSPLRAMVGFGALPFGECGPVQYERSWSPQALAWRTSHPSYTYALREADGTSLVLSERRQFGARYVLAARKGSFGTLPLRAEKESVRRKVFIGLDPGLHWKGCAYINVPMRLRPSPLNLILKDLTGAGRTLDPAQVRFQAIDFDIL